MIHFVLFFCLAVAAPLLRGDRKYEEMEEDFGEGFGSVALEIDTGVLDLESGVGSVVLPEALGLEDTASLFMRRARALVCGVAGELGSTRERWELKLSRRPSSFASAIFGNGRG